MSFGRILFDEKAFLANYELFRSRTTGQAGAVVKANAYGTGTSRAVRLLREAGCHQFFVAVLEEAFEVRVNTPGVIFIFSGPKNAKEAETIALEGFVPVLNTPSQIRLWKPYRHRACAIHVDTGMQRLGIGVEDCPDLSIDSFNVRLVMTHLACADEPDHPANRNQIQRFSAALNQFKGVPTSIGNSAGILNGTEFQGDIVRPGIGLYGGNPWRSLPNPMQAVVACEGTVLQVRTVRKGESVGYSAAYVAPDAIRVATVGLGYADGIPRSLSNRGECAFKGSRMPIIGLVSMDATQIECTHCPELNEGDYVQFFGDAISLDEFARNAGTISYEILTGLGGRNRSIP
ncbi:MAG: alanine racemase [Gammaproteobacteria bacterium]|nr:alanine racemase [Gammaproteobacteria bacterium]